MATSREDRAAGAIMGALIGDALGLGCHWYYDIDLLRQDYGTWVDGYRDQNPDRVDRFGDIARFRHQQGLAAGDLSQTGQMIAMLLESVAGGGQYVESDYTDCLDRLFATLDGSALSGRFTDRAVRETWVNRQSGLEWGNAGSQADTSEAASRAVVLAATYAGNTQELARSLRSNILLTHSDAYIAGCSYTFAIVVAALVEGVDIDTLGSHMGSMMDDPHVGPGLPSYDIASQVKDASGALEIDIDPVDVPRFYGLACTIGFLIPAAYYYLHRFPNSFEQAVLTAVNSGGNNMARATLTGALVGAKVGLSGIPQPLINNLSNGNEYARLAGSLPLVVPVS